ncbi:long-chain-fatty-acyl-CoA reductase [Metapseudomonas resinovorans]|uniref:acyl-CoA reductase n=1 Tax=Metapseudomonas resinovorans TaxID=53412 RepID=UPI000986CDC4|nr:acyl-CoA reductase [Pseudomonas resinovorans]GLZ84373.1 long-chain-fatty-acyl-CoA reductase [Pseudomonas resinovorans]
MNAVNQHQVSRVCHIVKGEVVEGEDLEYGPAHARFTTPALKLDELVWSRQEPGPAFDTPLDDILNILGELSRWLERDPEGLVRQALENAIRNNPMHPRVMQRSYEMMPRIFDRERLLVQIDNELGGKEAVDGWKPVTNLLSGRPAAMRAFPARILHIIAGNAPGVAAVSIARGAVTKAVNLIKLPSNDLFTAPAILRGISAVAPGHALARSFSAAYWRGGDDKVESLLMRPQFFDKLAAWGGDATLRSAKNYICPGFELVSFDPKTSISMIGREAFASDELLAEVADKAAADATLVEQLACASSRYQFVEGTQEQADRFADLLQQRMGVERQLASAEGRPVPGHLREEIDGLRVMPDYYRVWGNYSGAGVVIRSEEPVDFHPEFRVVNVVPVNDLRDALRFVNVATQTVSLYPGERKVELRDLLASAGAQRITCIGASGGMEGGLAHDGFLPLARLVRWINDEG